jgi:DNA gyrase subunit A
MATRDGTVKKTPLSAFSRPRASGIIAVDLRDDDRLVGVALTDGQREIMLFTSGGKCIRFNEEEVRPMGRDSTGVRGVKLGEGQALISLIVVGEGHVLTASANGYGKLTPLDDFPAHGRGGQGVIALQTTERNGDTVAALQVSTEHELMLISSNGTLVRTPVSDVSVVGRNTQGVRLIRLDEGDRLTGVERVQSLGEEFGAGDGDADSPSAGAEVP